MVMGDTQPGAYLVATPSEHWQWNGNGDIDAYLTNIYFMLELARCSARLCEDSCPVAVLVRIDYSNSVIKRVCVDNQKDRSKDFLSEGTSLTILHVVVTIGTYM